jgi:DNA topoisomerase-1
MSLDFAVSQAFCLTCRQQRQKVNGPVDFSTNFSQHCPKQVFTFNMDSNDNVPNGSSRTKKTGQANPDRVKSSNAKTAKKKKRKRDPESDKAPSSSSKKTKTANGKALKKLEKSELLQYAMQAFLWWNAKEPPEGCQWVTMEHAGVSFPEDYTPHGVKLLYDGKPVDLTPTQEES